ncbi:hypothetical protein ACICHK_41735 (plasmid) [Streptomyces sp. AHU1]|uniref:hypothetical protein n=1 Tax=Streptomyces sp. AHU1 TaxID=3377215 RepID=UPI003877A29C
MLEYLPSGVIGEVFRSGDVAAGLDVGLADAVRLGGVGGLPGSGVVVTGLEIVPVDGCLGGVGVGDGLQVAQSVVCVVGLVGELAEEVRCLFRGRTLEEAAGENIVQTALFIAGEALRLGGLAGGLFPDLGDTASRVVGVRVLLTLLGRDLVDSGGRGDARQLLGAVGVVIVAQRGYLVGADGERTASRSVSRP